MDIADSVIAALREAPGLPPWRDVLFISAEVAVLPERVRIPVNRLVPWAELAGEVETSLRDSPGALRLRPLAVHQNNLIVAWDLVAREGERAAGAVPAVAVDTSRFTWRGGP